MGYVTVVGPDGTETVEIASVPIQIHIEDHNGEELRLQPAAAREIEIENDGDVESVTDQCGRTEQYRQTDKNWKVKLDCIITSEPYRIDDVGGEVVRNLTLRRAMQLKLAREVKLEGAIFEDISGHFEIENVLVTQPNDLVSVNVGAGDQAAYELQLQLKQAEPGDI